jgi:two-component system nitrate/nitrite sensor histidine kinase NarX
MGLLFLAFFLLISISVAATFWIIDTQIKDALVVNLSGRQRMLVQQMTRDALQIEKGGGEEHVRSLQEAVDTFDQTLWALTSGGQAPYLPGQTVGVPATRHSGILKELNEVHHAWDTFRSYLDVIANEEPESPNFVIAMQAVERLSPDLVQQADVVVRVYETASVQKVTLLRWVQVAFFASALVLLIVGLQITRKSVLNPLHALGSAVELIGEGNLSSHVKVPGPREIETLAHSFDAMRLQLKASREELEMRVDQRTRELAALHEVTREISSRLEINHVLRSVTDKARELLDGEVGFLCLLDEEERTLSLEAVSGPNVAVSGARASARRSLAGQVLEGTKAIECGIEGCRGVCGIIAPPFRMSHVAAPLRVGEHVIGALCVSSSKAAAFAHEAAGLLTKLANSAAIALENANLYQQAERVAMLEERQRIAAEIHDGLAQTLSYLELKTEQVAELMQMGDAAEAEAKLKRVREAVGQAGQDARRAISNLQESVPRRQSLQDRLAETVDDFARSGGPSVALVAKLEPPSVIPSDVVEQVLRLVQEALQNVRRHAQANHVVVRLGRQEGEFVVAVEDDGRGFDPEAPPVDGSGHFGQSIMRARAARIGGHVSYHSEPDQGTRVILSWPIQRIDDRVAMAEWRGSTEE